MNGLNRSMGIGNSVVELFSVAISPTVCWLRASHSDPTADSATSRFTFGLAVGFYILSAWADHRQGAAPGRFAPLHQTKYFYPALGFLQRAGFKNLNPRIAFSPRPRNHPLIRRFDFSFVGDLRQIPYDFTAGTATIFHIGTDSTRCPSHDGVF